MAKYAVIDAKVREIEEGYTYLMQRTTVKQSDIDVTAKLLKNCVEVGQLLYIPRPRIPFSGVDSGEEWVWTRDALVWANQIMLAWRDIRSIVEPTVKSEEVEAIEDEILARN